jgi:spore coat protein U-like protein
MAKHTKTIFVFLSILVFFFKPEISLSQCNIRVTPMSFGNYDVFSSIPLDSSASITLDCSKDVTKADVTISESSISGTFNPRRMRKSGGSDLLDYNVFTDVTRTSILGNGTGGTTVVKLKRPTSKPEPWSQSIDVYGRIPPGQDVSAGNYSDSLTVTINW